MCLSNCIQHTNKLRILFLKGDSTFPFRLLVVAKEYQRFVFSSRAPHCFLWCLIASCTAVLILSFQRILSFSFEAEHHARVLSHLFPSYFFLTVLSFVVLNIYYTIEECLQLWYTLLLIKCLFAKCRTLFLSEHYKAYKNFIRCRFSPPFMQRIFSIELRFRWAIFQGSRMTMFLLPIGDN